MDVQIGSEASIATPAAGYRTLFINTDKGNQLYWKNSDGTVEPYTGDASEVGGEIASAWSAALSCALQRGAITAQQYEDLMNTGLTYTSTTTTDADGNTTTTVSVGSRNISLTAFAVNSSTGAVSTGTPTYQITSTFTPSNASNQGIIYVSSDPTKATVSATGLVTKVAVGTAIISVIPQGDQSLAKTVTITVS